MVVHSLDGAGHVVDLELAAAGCGPELGGGSLADVAVLVLLAPLEGLALRVGCAEGLAGGNVGQAAGALEEKVVAPDAALDAAGDTDGGRLGGDDVDGVGGGDVDGVGDGRQSFLAAAVSKDL